MRRYVVLMTTGLITAALSACGSGDSEGAETPVPENEATSAEAAEVTTEDAESYSAAVFIQRPDILVTAEVEGREDCDVQSAVPRSMGADYDDLDADTQVVFTDASGSIIATTGIWVVNNGVGGCVWMVRTADLPMGGEFYTATMGPWESAVIPESDVDEDGRLDFELVHPDY